jgi:protein-tyrosine phosphatase
MIDFHTHILPHMDDGAKNTDMAVAMLQSLYEQGVKTVLLTPHYYGKRSNPEDFVKRRNAVFEHINGRIPAGLETRLGAELHFTGINMPEPEELCKLAIEGTSCILVEFPFTEVWTSELLGKLSDFIHETGFTPIIAHIERYSEVQKKPSIVSDLMQMGCLIQVNASAFVEGRIRKLAFALLKHGFVHCIGTDAHNMDNRAPDLLLAKEAVEKAGYLEAWKRAENIMENILGGRQVCVECGNSVKKRFGRYV